MFHPHVPIWSRLQLALVSVFVVYLLGLWHYAWQRLWPTNATTAALSCISCRTSRLIHGQHCSQMCGSFLAGCKIVLQAKIVLKVLGLSAGHQVVEVAGIAQVCSWGRLSFHISQCEHWHS